MHAGTRLPTPGRYQSIVAVSAFHRDRRIVNPTGTRIRVLDLGVNAEDYLVQPTKVRGKLLYCSVPTKGVEHLPPIFRGVRDRFPDAELWLTSDMTLWGRESLGPWIQSLFDGIGGVHFLGAIPRAELVAHQLTAEVMAYPVQAPEHFCISAMECMAAGAVPVATRRGAMETTVAEYGILVPGDPHDQGFRRRFAESIVGLLSDRERLRGLAARARRRALEEYSWSALVVRQWEPFLYGLLEQGSPQAPAGCRGGTGRLE
jgi:glycosyltransferase involved in cell wall biosynthesis